jgi:predicted GIY-YIG superfamily endonuclease
MIRVYVGSTNDLRRRVTSHHQGHVISTGGNLPGPPRSYVPVANQPNARRLEWYFKSGSHRVFAMKLHLAPKFPHGSRPHVPACFCKAAAFPGR